MPPLRNEFAGMCAHVHSHPLALQSAVRELPHSLGPRCNSESKRATDHRLFKFNQTGGLSKRLIKLLASSSFEASLWLGSGGKGEFLFPSALV